MISEVDLRLSSFDSRLDSNFDLSEFGLVLFLSFDHPSQFLAAVEQKWFCNYFRNVVCSWLQKTADLALKQVLRDIPVSLAAVHRVDLVGQLKLLLGE